MAAAQEAAPRLGAARTCRALGLAKASYYRRLQPVPAGRAGVLCMAKPYDCMV
jgi:hypothetical protein